MQIVRQTLTELKSDKTVDKIDEILNSINQELKDKYNVRYEHNGFNDYNTFRLVFEDTWFFGVFDCPPEPLSLAVAFSSRHLQKIRNNPSDENIKEFVQTLYKELNLSVFLNS